ncbi:MAG: hypothetical protein HPY65_06865 [Syntrophaceae bacterium]|nr:hypothetical protein [Syntrophaceae bacterium]
MRTVRICVGNAALAIVLALAPQKHVYRRLGTGSTFRYETNGPDQVRAEGFR